MALMWGRGEAGGLCYSGEESKTIPGNTAASLKIVMVLRNPSAVWMCFPCAWGWLGPGALAAGYCVGRAATWAQVLGLLEREEREAGDSQGALFSLLFSFDRKWKNEMKIKDTCKTGGDRCGDKDGRRIKGRNKKNKKRKMRESSLRPEPRGQLKEAQRCQRRETDTHIQRCRCAGKHIHTYVQQMYREKCVWAFLGDFNCDIQLEKRSQTNSIFEPFKTLCTQNLSWMGRCLNTHGKPAHSLKMLFREQWGLTGVLSAVQNPDPLSWLANPAPFQPGPESSRFP